MKRVAVLMVVAACGHGPASETGGVDSGAGVDTGTSSGSDGGTSSSSDGGAGDGGAGGDGGPSIDPATCTVGVADGCCPTAVAYGGHDPDCASLGCANVQLSDPIALDDWQTQGISGVGMAWTGTELVLAWPSVGGSWPSTYATIVYERRDASGALTYGPVVHDDHATAVGTNHATPELGFEPTKHTILFASSKLYRRYAETLDDQGAPASPATNIGVDCNPIMARYQIYPWQGSFLVAQDNSPCSSTEWHGPRVDTFSTAGVHTDFTLGDEGAHMLGMTFDGERVVFSGGNLMLTERVFTPPSTWSAPRTLANLSVYDTGISASGDSFLVAYGTYYLSNHQITSDPWAGTWTLDGSGVPVPATPAAALTVGANRQTIAPRIVWTGDGWFELMSGYPWEGSGLPASWTSFSTLVWSFAPDGSLRESFALDPMHPTYLVNAIWAGGKVAITYVTMDAQARERRFLRYLSCAPTM